MYTKLASSDHPNPFIYGVHSDGCAVDSTYRSIWISANSRCIGNSGRGEGVVQLNGPQVGSIIDAHNAHCVHMMIFYILDSAPFGWAIKWAPLRGVSRETYIYCMGPSWTRPICIHHGQAVISWAPHPLKSLSLEGIEPNFICASY